MSDHRGQAIRDVAKTLNRSLAYLDCVIGMQLNSEEVALAYAVTQRELNLQQGDTIRELQDEIERMKK